MQIEAVKKGWEIIPSGHTPRITLFSELVIAGFDRERLTQHFGWKTDSSMIRHYEHFNVNKSENSVADYLARNND